MLKPNNLIVLLVVIVTAGTLSAGTGQDGTYKVLVSGKSQAEADVSAISQDSSLVCLGGYGAIRIYDARSGQRLNSFAAYHPVKKMVIPRGNTALYCLSDEKILKYSLPEGQLLWQREINDIYPCMQFSADGTRLYSLGRREEGQPIMQLNLKNGAPLKTYFVPKAGQKSKKNLLPDPDRWNPEYIALRPDGSAAATVNTGTDMAEVFLTESGKNYSVRIHEGTGIRLALHPRKPEMALLSRDSLFVHNWEDGRLLHKSSLGAARTWWYSDLRYSPDGKLFSCIRAADAGKKAVLVQHLYSTDGYKVVGRKEFPQPKKDITRVLGQECAFTYTRDSIGEDVYFVRRYSLADHRELYTQPCGLSQPFFIRQVLLSPGGRWTAIETEIDFVLWDNAAGRSMRRLPKTDQENLTESVMEFTANDSLLLIHFGPLHVLNCVGGGGTIYTDTAEVAGIHPQGKSLALLSGPKMRILNLPDGKSILKQTVLAERTYLLPKFSVPDTGREVKVKPENPGLKFSRNGRYVFVSYNHSFLVPGTYIPNEFFNLKRVDVERAEVLSLGSLNYIPSAYVPDPAGEYVFFENYNEIKSYDIFKEVITPQLKLPEDRIRNMKLSADGKILSASYTQYHPERQDIYLHFNLLEGKLDTAAIVYGEKGRLKTELLSSAAPFLASASSDGRSAEFRDGKGILLLSLSFPDPGSWVATTPDGFLELSAYALQWIQFTDGYSLETSGRLLEERRKTGLFQKRVSR